MSSQAPVRKGGRCSGLGAQYTTRKHSAPEHPALTLPLPCCAHLTCPRGCSRARAVARTAGTVRAGFAGAIAIQQAAGLRGGAHARAGAGVAGAAVGATDLPRAADATSPYLGCQHRLSAAATAPAASPAARTHRGCLAAARTVPAAACAQQRQWQQPQYALRQRRSCSIAARQQPSPCC